MNKRRSLVVIFLLEVLLSTVCTVVSAAPARTVLTAATRVGWTLSAPDVQALDFVGVPQSWQKMNALTYGVLLQGLVRAADLPVGTLRLGGEMSFSWLFTSKVQDPSIPYSIGATLVSEDLNVDRELSLSFGGVAQLEVGKHLVFQGGLGAHIVMWFYDFSYQSSASVDSSSDSGTAVVPALMVAAGTNLRLSETMMMPLMIRVDLLLRYGVMVPVTVTAGVSFPL